MADVAVATLSLTAPAGRVAETRQRTEDALRLVAGEEGRLLVLRRLDLGSVPIGAPAAVWEARAGERIAALKARAVHGGDGGAASAEAVWFRSADEARALLLTRLARGESVGAWYWRLAVRGWRGDPVSVLAAWIAEARARPERLRTLAAAVVALLARGHTARLVAWFAVMPPAEGARNAAERAASQAQLVTAAVRTAQPPSIVNRLRRLLELLPAAARKEIRAAAARGVPVAVLHWLARFCLIDAAPELAGREADVQALADVWLAMVDDEEGAAAPSLAAMRGEPPADRHEAHPGDPPAELAAPTIKSIDDHDAAPPPRADIRAGEPPRPQPIPSDELHSLAAGVLLTIRPLWRMGIGEWLEARPELLVAGFGRALLAHVARRMRVPPRDPLFALLDAPDDLDPISLTAWRVGVDRWLRRRARVRLADLAATRGWLTVVPEGLDIRFRPEDADIRLRRLALDLDPGWVPWLGLVVRYHYREARSW